MGRIPLQISDLKRDLENRYEIICFIDLADVVIGHGEIFRLFKKYHREEFQHSQRLVFYSSNTSIPQLVFDHIQYAAARVDISNFFIMFCTPNDITKNLIQANQTHGHDDVRMTWFLSDLAPTKPFDDINIYDRKSLCPLPFQSLNVTTNGTIHVCCKIKQKLGRINDRSLADAFNDDQLIKLREKIKAGEKAEECQVCWKVEELGGTSLRLHALEKYRDDCDQILIDNPQVKTLDICPSNLCNFKCRICNPFSSSRIAAEELQYTNSPQKQIEIRNLARSLAQTDTKKYLDSVLDISSTLDYLHVMGGEPFMFPELDTLLEKIILNGNSHHMRLEFNTNGSQWPEKIISKFNHFKAIEILLSIDNIGDRFEIERGGVWKEVESNIKKFSALRSSRITVKLTIAVNIQNLLYLDEVVNLAQDLNLDIVWGYLEDPAHLSIDNVTQLVKDLVYQKYHDHPVDELVKICHRLQKTPASNGKEFLAHMSGLDRRRGENFSKTHREIFEAMGGEID